jgi:hypothetical protein
VVRRPELHLPDDLPFLLQNRDHLPEIPIEEFRLQGNELLVHELPHHPDDSLHLVRQGEIHGDLLIFSSPAGPSATPGKTMVGLAVRDQEWFPPEGKTVDGVEARPDHLWRGLWP